MRRKYILVITFAIIIFFSEYFVMASWLASITSSSENQDAMNLPNIRFTDIRYYNDSLSDSNGSRAFPWGIEIWSINGTMGFPSSYFTKGQVQLIGHSIDDVVVLAIPDPPNKPLVKAELSYTQSFEIKLDNVQGHGVRLIHQWFNSSNIRLVNLTVRGTFEEGTSDWHTISLTVTAPATAVHGDIVCELWGTGTVYIRNPEYHVTTVVDVLSVTTVVDVLSKVTITHNQVAMWLIASFVIAILIAESIALISFVVESVNELFKHPKHQRIVE